MPDDDALRVQRGLVIPPDELTFRATGSGGPGGQHANTANTRVEITFDVRASRVLGPRQRARLLARLGPVVRVVASDTRSQSRNRELARARLATRLAEGLREEEPRIATKPSRSSKAARVEQKRRRSEVKAWRRRPAPDT